MKGAVTASTQAAADAGAAILRAGGNAADAAVAAGLATCVADPCNTGLGGYGGYLVVQRPGEAARCVQFPLCARQDDTPESLAAPGPDTGPGCSTLPQVVAGLARALEEFGTLSWAAACAPAIALAREGVLANATNTRALGDQRDAPFVAECFVIETGPSGVLRFRQPLLARTLEAMAAHGAGWFYDGPLAGIAERAWRDAGFALDAREWRRGGEAVRTVPAATYEAHGIRLHAGPLGLSGSACLFATFAAAARIAREASIVQPEGLAALAGAMAAIWQHRFAHNDFTRVGIDAWIEAALADRDAGRQGVAEAAHTAHLNAVDGEGMLAALTFTHGPAWFGGRWALPGSGVVMNGGMHNFRRAAPVRDGARWLGASNMAPTIADDGRGGRVALGCPGARRIPSNVAMVLARRYLAGEPLQAAVSGGRLHAEGRDRVFWEVDRLPPETREALQPRFGRVDPEDSRNYFGPLSALGIDAAGAVELALDDRDWRAYGARA